MSAGQEDKEVAKKELVEAVGVKMEHLGFPRMVGRVLGYLFIAEPPYKTFNDIQEYLQASKSSISTSLQLLINQEMVKYFTAPGDRRRYFKLNVESWPDRIRKDVSQITDVRKLIRASLALRSDQDRAFNAELEKISDFYGFLEKELPALWERWQREKPNR